MHRDRGTKGFSRPSGPGALGVPAENSVETGVFENATVPACHSLPPLEAVAVNAADVDCHTTAALSTRPPGTAAASTVRSAFDCILRTTPPPGSGARLCVPDTCPSGTTEETWRDYGRGSPVRVNEASTPAAGRRRDDPRRRLRPGPWGPGLR